MNSFVKVPPSGGSLEIGNWNEKLMVLSYQRVPPSGGSLEIGNTSAPINWDEVEDPACVPPSGGSLEIGNI